ncbi:hypothetical protein Poli38472_013243 [Pythium oligandrum]|uniref:Uncharacterized protein n=1 Tax=Pythium oligandrum TaxID=41045 RepID=A0A8K1FDA0_PYTOL|nr:hypothetical protein Poli38472_013243 [Pythium oligandrum]|eukprot:TMW55352.1 hypothetical protein Poli38472_013243 [Pythium oligandrum]
MSIWIAPFEWRALRGRSEGQGKRARGWGRRGHLARVVAAYAPEKTPEEVELVLNDYAGREEQLIKWYVAKYALDGMEDVEWMLNAVFRFKHMKPSDDQTPEFCKRLAQVMVKFMGKCGGAGSESRGVSASRDGPSPHFDPLEDDTLLPVDEFSTMDGVCLKQAMAQLGRITKPQRGDIWCEAWFPQFAGMLQMVCTSVKTVRLRIIALDGWERVLHFLPDGSSVSSAVAKTHKVLNCGDLDLELRADFQQALANELNSAKQRKESSRSGTWRDTGTSEDADVPSSSGAKCSCGVE